MVTEVNSAGKVPISLPKAVLPPNLPVPVSRPASLQPSWDGFSHQSRVCRAPPATRSFHPSWAYQAGAPLGEGSHCRSLGSAESAATHTPLQRSTKDTRWQTLLVIHPSLAGNQHRLRAWSGQSFPDISASLANLRRLPPFLHSKRDAG
jgi:hypothetical protein